MSYLNDNMPMYISYVSRSCYQKYENNATAIASVYSSCTLNMFKFPYDTEYCSLNFGNIIEPAELVDLTWDTPEVDLIFNPSNEFDVKSQAADRVMYTVGISAFFAKIVSVLLTHFGDKIENMIGSPYN